jgi:hypothetical protein
MIERITADQTNAMKTDMMTMMINTIDMIDMTNLINVMTIMMIGGVNAKDIVLHSNASAALLADQNHAENLNLAIPIQKAIMTIKIVTK